MSIPSAAKKLISASESMGFTVHVREFTFHKPEVLWASTADGHNEGDVRTPAKDLDGVQIIGYRKEARLGFDAMYAGGFQAAKVYDPVGRPKELVGEYSYGVKEAGMFGYSKDHADKLSEARDQTYNDGEQYLQKEWWLLAATEFYNWIDEWLKMLKSEHPPISPKPRAPRKTKAEKAAEADAQILAGGEWSG